MRLTQYIQLIGLFHFPPVIISDALFRAVRENYQREGLWYVRVWVGIIATSLPGKSYIKSNIDV